MRILDKYIIKELLGPFIFGIAAFTGVFVGTNTLFRIAQFVTKYGAKWGTVVQLFLYNLPPIIDLTLPMSMLLASLLSFGRLSGSSEITAMRSGGISFFRLSTPVFIFAFCVSIFSIYFHENVVPQANAGYNRIVDEIQNNTMPKSQENVIIPEVRGDMMRRLTYARKFEASNNTMHGVSVQEFDNKGNIARVENAQTAMFANNRWTMYNGVVHDLTGQDGTDRVLHFKEQVMPVTKTPREISVSQKRPEEMTIKELKQEIAFLRSEGAPTGIYEVELYQRITIPMTCFIFAMIGAPLGLQPHRSSSSIGFGISLIIIFIYYAIMTFTTTLGQGGAIPPALGAWLPNLIGVLVGGTLVYRKSR
jgi:lipopolysaccharide export system permease protein